MRALQAQVSPKYLHAARRVCGITTGSVARTVFAVAGSPAQSTGAGCERCARAQNLVAQVLLDSHAARHHASKFVVWFVLI